MTAQDAIALEHADARRALLARIDELGDLLILARQAAILDRPLSLLAMHIKLVGIGEAAEIRDALAAAVVDAQH